jgi:hypothetical protein
MERRSLSALVNRDERRSRQSGFFFYAPLPYYLTSLFYPLFSGESFAWRQLGASATLAIVASGLTAFVWLRRIVGEQSACISAVLYIAAPYHLTVNLYIRAAFAELWAFVWLPLVLHFAGEISRRRHVGFVGLATSYAALVMTHLPTTLIFSLLPLVYAPFFADARNRLKTLIYTIGAMSLGVGLSAIYLLPAMLTQDFVSMHKMRTEFLYYERWFLFFQPRVWGPVLGTALLIICAIRLALSNRTQLKRWKFFWLAVAAISLFMMTWLSKFVWQTITILQKIQFPWRFSSIFTLAATAIFALAIDSLKRPFGELIKLRPTRFPVRAALIVLLIWLTSSAIMAWAAFPVMNPRATKRMAEQSVRIDLHQEVREYMPHWVEFDTHDSRYERILLKQFLPKIHGEGRTPRGVFVSEGTGSAQVDEWQLNNITLRVTAASDVVINVVHFYYPNWTAAVAGTDQRVNVTATALDGFIRIEAPTGDYRINLQFTEGLYERIGRITSAVSLTILLSLAFYNFLRRRKLIRTESEGERAA